jgi:hypothetical protein
VSLRWPEDEAPVASPRRTQRTFGGEFDATFELLEPEAGDTDRDSARAQPILVVLVIAVLVLIGALLFWLGPLPTIFPPLECGDCGVLGP